MSNTSTGYLTAEELSIQNHICVLPCGDLSEVDTIDWSKEDLEHYQYYFVDGKPVDKMFRAFIFNPIQMRKDYFIHVMHTGIGKPARNNDWQMAIDHLFKENVNFSALAQNTKKGDTTDIWVTIPYPNPLQENFGKVLGNKLDFSNETDQIKAIQWWIDSFIMRWEKETHLHDTLSFKGFVWQRSSINEGDENLVKETNDYIHNRGFLSLWLFNYGSSGCVEWSDFKFDAACANPNYYGNTNIDISWIKNSTAFASHYHTGMQIIYGKGKLFNDTHIYDYLNLGVSHGYMNNSLVVFQFPNQTMKMIYDNDRIAYVHIYSFIKKIYQHYSYPGISY